MNQEVRNICFSITATGKCNCACEYCHFYAKGNRAELEVDISDKLFKRYVELIKYMISQSYNISIRFSGGEPLCMGEKLFEMANYVYMNTNIKPFVLTNGKLLTRSVIEKSARNNIHSYVVSFENPFKQSKNAESTENNVKKYSELQNNIVPLQPGIIVLENSEFKHIKKIADYFWERLKILPAICEKNYSLYEAPTDEEIVALKDGVREIVQQYNGKSNLSLFPYIVPELYAEHASHQSYLVELKLFDHDGIGAVDNKTAEKIIHHKINNSFLQYDCPNKSCEMIEYCQRIKWVWFYGANGQTTDERLKDYCKLKLAITDAFYEALYA